VAYATLIHGIGNKPEPRISLAQRRAALVDDDGVVLDALEDISSVAYWAEVPLRQAALTSRDDGWPSHRLGDEPWSNLYDTLDSVCCGFDRRIAGDFVRAGASRAADMSVTNVGSRRHAIANYLGQNRLRALLWELIG
jgi:hypothetical protein